LGIIAARRGLCRVQYLHADVLQAALAGARKSPAVCREGVVARGRGQRSGREAGEEHLQRALKLVMRMSMSMARGSPNVVWELDCPMARLAPRASSQPHGMAAFFFARRLATAARGRGRTEAEAGCRGCSWLEACRCIGARVPTGAKGGQYVRVSHPTGSCGTCRTILLTSAFFLLSNQLVS
jgi:hypothetical protein